MSDRFFASIRLGGPIRARDVDGLAKAIHRENLLDSECNCVELASPADIAKYVINGELYFQDSEAREGRFLELEPFLIGRAISFNRFSEGCGDRNAVRLYFRPGMREPLTRLCDNQGEEVVYRRAVKELLKLRTAADLLNQLQDLLGPEPLPLRPIEPEIFKKSGGSA